MRIQSLSVALMNTVSRLANTPIWLGQWWLGEFLLLFPERTRQWLIGSDQKSLILESRENDVELRLLSNGSRIATAEIPCAEYSANSVDEFLSHHQLKRSDVAIGITLPQAQIFERKIILPIQAARSLDTIVAQDLAQKTPFKPVDIHHDYAFVETGNKIVVTQWLALRASVNTAAAALRLDVSDASFLQTASGNDNLSPRATIVLRPDENVGKSWVRRATIALAVSALLLALTAGTARYLRQQSALNELKQQLASAKKKARNIRNKLAKLEHEQKTVLRIRMMKYRNADFLDIWEEATRRLPSDSWLTELRVTNTSWSSERRVTLSGFSSAAARLVNIFDESVLFRDAALTAAISLDPIEQRERFSIQMNIRNATSRGTAP